MNARVSIERDGVVWTWDGARGQIEGALVALGELESLARDAVKAALSLDEKVRYQRFKRDIEEARRLVRRSVFEAEDAEAVVGATSRCGECGEVTP